MGTRKKIAAKSFKEIIERIDGLAGSHKVGLRAFLGTHRSKVQLGKNSDCDGSVDIDTYLTDRYPQANRWDYVFSYKTEAFFVEIHSASTGEVSTVLKKLQWLKDWLNSNANDLNKLRPKKQASIFWIQSNGFHILPNSPQMRKVSQAGIKPISKLILN
jgi:hypothetical protein